jgi:hypothetical protein
MTTFTKSMRRERPRASVKDKQYRTKVNDIVNPHGFIDAINLYFEKREKKNTDETYMYLDEIELSSNNPNQVFFNTTYGGVRGNSPSDIDRIAKNVAKKINETIRSDTWDLATKILQH